MDIVSFILSEKRATPRVKSKCIVMLAVCNIDKAPSILQILESFKLQAPEIISNVLVKLESVSAYYNLLHKNAQTNTNSRLISIPNPNLNLNLNTQPSLSHKRLKISDQNVPNTALIEKQNVIPTNTENSQPNVPLTNGTAIQQHNVNREQHPNNISIKSKDNENSKLFLYLFFLNYPLQCRVCGFRFSGNADGKTALGLHLDEHARRERLELSAKTLSQEYFLTYDQFISKVKIQFEEIKKEEEFIMAENAFCEICKEKIDILWNDERGSWMLVDVIPMENYGERRFCHRKCST